MKRALVPVLTLVVGLAVGGLAARWLLADEEKPTPEVVPMDVALERPESEPSRGRPKMPPEGLLPPEAETHPEYFEDLEGEAPVEGAEDLPARVEYPRLAKLAVESEVPHRTVGAWDEDPESPAPGVRRAFVVVVEPDLGDAALEALARDLRDQHQDARILNVRIFDSEEGARRASWVDGGALAHEHLVAQVNINRGLDLDVIRIRGRVIRP